MNENEIGKIAVDCAEICLFSCRSCFSW